MPFQIYLPIFTALACWLCITGVIYFLFYPIRQRKFGPIKLQGLLPGQQKRLAGTLSEYIYGFILDNKPALDKEINNPDRMEKLLPEIEKHIETFLKVKLPQSMPMIAMLIGDKTIIQVKEVFVNEIKVLFPQILVQFTDKMLVDQQLATYLYQRLSAVELTTTVAGIVHRCRPYFVRLKIMAFVFGLLFGVIVSICVHSLT